MHISTFSCVSYFYLLNREVESGGNEGIWGNEGGLPEHIPCNSNNSTQGSLARHSGRFLQPRFDGVDGGVGEGSHGAGDEADDGGLVAGDGACLCIGVAIFGAAV